MKKAIIIMLAITSMFHAGITVKNSAEGWCIGKAHYTPDTPFINEKGDVCCNYYAEIKMNDGWHVLMAHAENGRTVYVDGEDELCD